MRWVAGSLKSGRCAVMSASERFWRFVGRFDPFAKGALALRDLERHPIWEHAISSEGLPWRDESWVQPVRRRTIPWDAYSLTVAAWLTLRSGERFDGSAYVSTAEGVVDVPMGSVWIGGRWYFIPVPGPIEAGAREELAGAVGGKVEEVFPIRWTLKVPIEGEEGLRSEEFRAGE
jgi:hypothetical protein